MTAITNEMKIKNNHEKKKKLKNLDVLKHSIHNVCNK